MNTSRLKKEITQLISLRQEGEYWDFKKEWYTNKPDLLHDILCMANNLSSRDGLIIIGVDEKTDYSTYDVKTDPNRKKTQDIVSFLRDKKFAGGIRPTVFVQSISFSSKEVDIIVVNNDRNTPYYLIEQYQGVCANNIYTRIMDTNTPKNISADINIVERLWKKRFGLDATTIERAMLFLQNPSGWVISDDDKKYYVYAPEFTIEAVSADESRNGYEFYLFGQCDSRPRWYDINIYYHQTLLASLGGAALDGGRYFTATPQTDGIALSSNNYHWDILYKYFMKDSIEYIVHRFHITDDMDEELTSRSRFLECVLVFNTEIEKEAFERFVICNYAKYDTAEFVKRLPNFPDIDGYIMDAFKKQYLDSLLLQQMLNDYRS